MRKEGGGHRRSVGLPWRGPEISSQTRGRHGLGFDLSDGLRTAQHVVRVIDPGQAGDDSGLHSQLVGLVRSSLRAIVLLACAIVMLTIALILLDFVR